MEAVIRKLVIEYRDEILRGNLMPERAAELLIKLSALFGNLNDDITEQDMKYNQVLLKCYDEEKSANRAKIKAGITPEYKAMRDARNIKDLTLELIRSLKYFLRNWEQEKKEATFQ